MSTIELTSLAARQIAAAREWWLAHRDKAPNAFDDDLDALLGRLEDRARIVGRPVVGQTGVRRVYRKRIRYFVYFEEIDDGARVRVLALWHAGTGDRPSSRASGSGSGRDQRRGGVRSSCPPGGCHVPRSPG